MKNHDQSSEFVYPSAQVVGQANISEYESLYKRSIKNREEFWSEEAAKLEWYKKWDTVLSWDFKKPEVKWYEGAKLNITENCIDRHLERVEIKPLFCLNLMIQTIQRSILLITSCMNALTKWLMF